MKPNIDRIIKNAFIKHTDIDIKATKENITRDKLTDLLETLILITNSEIHHHRVSNFVTDN